MKLRKIKPKFIWTYNRNLSIVTHQKWPIQSVLVQLVILGLVKFQSGIKRKLLKTDRAHKLPSGTPPNSIFSQYAHISFLAQGVYRRRLEGQRWHHTYVESDTPGRCQVSNSGNVELWKNIFMSNLKHTHSKLFLQAIYPLVNLCLCWSLDFISPGEQ